MSILKEYGYLFYRDRQNGLTYHEIEAKYGFCRSTIANTLQSYRRNKKLPLKQHADGACPSGEVLNKLNFMGMRSPELAARFNCDIEEIRETLRSYRERVYG